MHTIVSQNDLKNLKIDFFSLLVVQKSSKSVEDSQSDYQIDLKHIRDH